MTLFVKGGEKPDQRAEQNTATAAVGVRWSEGVGMRPGAVSAGNEGRAYQAPRNAVRRRACTVSCRVHGTLRAPVRAVRGRGAEREGTDEGGASRHREVRDGVVREVARTLRPSPSGPASHVVKCSPVAALLDRTVGGEPCSAALIVSLPLICAPNGVPCLRCTPPGLRQFPRRTGRVRFAFTRE